MKSALLVVIPLLGFALLSGCGGGSGGGIVPPASVTFTSTPPSSASEGQTYSYTMAASGPSPVSFQLASGPASASISGSTLTWVPLANESRVSNSFSVKATAGSAVAFQNWTLTPSGTVQGSSVTTHVTSSGDTQVPTDTSQSPITVAAPDGKGGFSVLSGTGSPNGSYSIADVPGGHFWLQVEPQTYVWTGSSLLDTGHDALGRPNATLPTAPTQLDLGLTSLSPWQPDDHQQLYVSNTDTWLDYQWSQWGLADGSTSLLQPIPWTNPLIDASQGDQAYVTQLVTTPAASGFSVQVLAKSLEDPIADVTQVDGTEMEVDGDLEDLDRDHFLRGNIAGSAFASLESAMNPNAVPDSSYFFLDVHPGGTQKGWIGGTPDLVIFDGTGSPIRTNVDMGDIAYGNPYPGNWDQFLEYTHYVRVDYTAPGAANSTSHYGYLELQTTTLPTVNSTVTPLIGPVSSPRINGVSFFSNQTSVGLTPTLSWSAPSLGTPTGYELEVYRLYSDGTDSLTEPAGTLYATATTIQLPPGLLVSGNSYYICLSAVYQPGTNYETAPFRHAFPNAVGQALSGVITP